MTRAIIFSIRSKPARAAICSSAPSATSCWKRCRKPAPAACRSPATWPRKVGQYFQKFGKNRTEVNTLTPREQEVLQLLADGFRYKEIAGVMGISLDTVREHARRIYSKLHVTSRTEAVVKYLGGSNQSAGNG